jgi:outer membrane immunogenic protein
MRKLLTTNLVLSALAVMPAMAADVAVKARPTPALAPVFTWTGCYIGSFVGGGWGRQTNTSNGVLGGGGGASSYPAGSEKSSSFSIIGYMSGWDVGCQYQTANWVFGIEGDWSWANKSGSNFLNPPNSTFRLDSNERWFATARGKLGYTWNNWLWYVTGGAAWANLDISEYNGSGTFLASDRQTMFGWTAGVGSELGLGRFSFLNLFGGQLSLKADYLYADLGKKDFLTANTCCTSQNTHLTQHVVRAGLNYRLDWGQAAPVAARY